VSKKSEAAYRARMGLVAALQACQCDYPNVRASTKTEHEEQCPAHLMLLERVDPEEHAVHRKAMPFGMRPDPAGGWIGRCSACKGEFRAPTIVGLARAMVAEHDHGGAAAAAAAEAKGRAEMAAVFAEMNGVTP
jgi:hypothetical protein